MPQVKLIKICPFADLTPSAKEKAREWYRGLHDTNDMEFSLDDAVHMGELLGIEFDTTSVPSHGGGTRSKPKIWYSVSNSQGDGACFEGRYRYKPGSVKAIKTEAPQDETLHKIAQQLQEVQRPYFYKLCAHCKHSGRYNHANSMSVEPFHYDNEFRDVDESDVVQECLRDFANWIYSQLQKEVDYQYSAEYIDESIEANEYTFTEDGERAD